MRGSPLSLSGGIIGAQEAHVAPREWHPKITPYRLIVVLTPIALGSAKLAFTCQGNGRATTTSEWVLGVVVFLLLYVLSPYESLVYTRPPLGLGWLFSPDCFHRVADPFNHLPHSQHRSDEIPVTNDWETHPAGDQIPLFTTYRLIVSLTVFILGMTKAVLGYFSSQQLGSALFDWVTGAGAASILYYVGLFENNSVGLGHSFFKTDRYREVIVARDVARSILLYPLIIYTSFAWSTLCAPMWVDPYPLTNTSTTELGFILRDLTPFMVKRFMFFPTSGFGILPLVGIVGMLIHFISPNPYDSNCVPIGLALTMVTFLPWGAFVFMMLRNPAFSDFEPNYWKFWQVVEVYFESVKVTK